jgi:secretion/DNA translocation related CpaE-like protein
MISRTSGNRRQLEATPSGLATAALPLLITADPELLDDVVRLAAAAGVDLQVMPDPGAARPIWSRAPVVLVGDDAAEAVGRVRLRRRAGVVVIGRDLDDAGVWRRAVLAGAEHVALLPEAEPWLIARLGDLGEAGGAGCLRLAKVVSVVGGRGGAGASTLAAALAVTAMRQRRPTVLIDADPFGGGADLLFGGEAAAGLRWPDLASAHGRIAGHALREALPSLGELGELAVLSWDRGDLLDLTPEVMESVLQAARRAGELVVIDSPRRFDGVSQSALGSSDVALVVVPAEVRAVAAAARVIASVQRLVTDVRLVVRGPAPGGLDAADVAAALALPLAGSLKAEPDLAAALERGEAPAGRGVGPLAEFCSRWLRDLDEGSAPDTTGGWDREPTSGWSA